MAEAAKKTETTEEKKSGVPTQLKHKGTIRCRVHRQGENKDTPIVVTVNDIKSKKEFWPGQEVFLTREHIKALRNACIDSEIPLPENSGVYQSANPVFEAQKQNPGYKVETDLRTGTIVLRKSQPLYIVEILDA